MPIQIDASSIAFENETIPFADFGKLIERHLDRVPNTPNLESEGSRLKSADFAEQPLEAFIRHVCVWGGYAGIGGRIINQNSMTKISECFRSAMAKLEINVPDISGALQEVNFIRGLGTPSFASKHLRFLRPDICPILDSIIAKRLDYPFTRYGYQKLSSDCAKITVLLQSNQIANPRYRGGNEWYTSDVEMAIFSRLKKL